MKNIQTLFNKEFQSYKKAPYQYFNNYRDFKDNRTLSYNNKIRVNICIHFLIWNCSNLKIKFFLFVILLTQDGNKILLSFLFKMNNKSFLLNYLFQLNKFTDQFLQNLVVDIMKMSKRERWENYMASGNFKILMSYLIT